MQVRWMVMVSWLAVGEVLGLAVVTQVPAGAGRRRLLAVPRPTMSKDELIAALRQHAS
jgi:hypothetical protein